MKTVGSMLKQARIAKGLTPAQVEKDIKIREKFIRAMEADSFRELPSPSYAKGFVRNYAAYVGLDTDIALAFYRRQIADTSGSSLLPKGVADPLNRPFLHITPGRFIGFLVALLFLIFFGYLGSQYIRINEPPPLDVTSPVDQQIVTKQHVAIEGRTDPDASLVVNGVSTVVRDDGRFYIQISLDPGVNHIVVTATSRFGKTTSVEREVGFTQSK